jgi:hypothetical protein
MPIRSDESELWAAFGPPPAPYRWPRDAAAVLGVPRNRLVYLCSKWADQGQYEWGSWIDLGWKI